MQHKNTINLQQAGSKPWIMPEEELFQLSDSMSKIKRMKSFKVIAKM
jgi:hypothetical protein